MTKKNKNKNDNKYNSDNEIIIGVTTKKQEKVRVEKKSTRTKNKLSTQKNKKNYSVSTKNTKRKVDHDKDEKDIKKMNRKKIMISIIILFLIILGGTIYYLTTPVFNIASIEVYGNEKNTKETYISLSKIIIGNTNIFAFTNSNMRNNIKENAYVENVEIKRKLPNTIQLYITERKVAYQIQYAENYVYIDNQGYILEINEKKEDVPIIKGFSSIQETMQPGKRLATEDLLKLNTISKIMNYCDYNSIENEITNIDASNTSNYILNFEKDKKILYLGDASNLSERLTLLKTILKNEKGKKGEIFMNGDVNTDKVYFREDIEK